MYSVNDKPFKSYLKAINEATKTNSIVIEKATGIIRWQPAEKVSKKEIRRYNEQKNAYNAQEN